MPSAMRWRIIGSAHCAEAEVTRDGFFVFAGFATGGAFATITGSGEALTAGFGVFGGGARFATFNFRSHGRGSCRRLGAAGVGFSGFSPDAIRCWRSNNSKASISARVRVALTDTRRGSHSGNRYFGSGKTAGSISRSSTMLERPKLRGEENAREREGSKTPAHARNPAEEAGAL
jgi:hypothetical protein